MRHPEQRVLDRKREDALEICRKAAGRCRPIVDEIIRVPCTALDQDLQSRIAHTSKRLGLATHSMASGAGHDSRNLARHCRTAMIFVPSRNGISHNPDEYTSPEQLANGAKVLAEVIAELARI
jgi:N-carbamoyl-L-amino-acid hydrolase